MVLINFCAMKTTKNEETKLGRIMAEIFAFRKKSKGTFLRINGNKEYRNAKLYFEDACIIMHKGDKRREVCTVYRWEDVFSIQYE